MPNKRPAVFVDRDNTLIHDPGYLRHAEHVRLLTGVGEAVAKLRNAGFPVVVVTNQSGVARGYLTESELAAVHQRMQELLQSNGSGVDAIYYCPFLTGPEAVVDQYRKDSELRKPKPGMLLQAATDLNLDLANSWMIGDSERDVMAGKAVGCKTILIGNGNIDVETPPDYTSAGFAKAAEIVLRETKVNSAPKTAAPAQSSGANSVSTAPPKPQATPRPKPEIDAGGGTAVATAPAAVRVADPQVRILEPSAAAARRNVVDARSPKPVAENSPARTMHERTAPEAVVEAKPDAAQPQKKETSLPMKTAAAEPIARSDAPTDLADAALTKAPQHEPRKPFTDGVSAKAQAAVEPAATATAPSSKPEAAKVVHAEFRPTVEPRPAPESGATNAAPDLHPELPITRAPEPTLGQVLEEMRMMRREKNSADFSFAQLAGAIVQAFAICALAFGLYAAVNGDTAVATFRVQLAIAFQLMALTGFILNRKP
ncbi:MAG: HAD-IIIA family hydrolase [Planctomycetes bacterium]|nr:HAD-IIIA family hydrolase [Planctomycetota bacterium]